ncbi:hypothetical protein GR160_11780 [Flavobacterium sp. Sd200]|uniref:putative porin n=1 Tax=Flavobacterium sp. Sd200 TaxID=2692211 RepID=UPI00136D3D9C|nr:putative porin [Flavobacterium sp. Sd200]MXN91903.1 hypothetical protein [Flavobacterium sp. Sd200]
MLRKSILFLLLIIPAITMAQVKLRGVGKGRGGKTEASANDKKKGDSEEVLDSIASIDMYQIVTLERDTTIVDTSLTIQKEYRVNYLRKDNFGLLAFNNEGQTYNTLDYGLTDFNPFPKIGFKAKHFAYMEPDDIKYYHVATPYTDLMYRSVMQQGQMLDASITMNTSENLNLFIGYKGLRSIGKYINALSSNGNFRLGGSYNTTDKRYILKLHFTGQDFSNGENGGITDTSLFESGEDPYTQRERLAVYFNDAKSVLKGNRYFVDHTFRLSKDNPNSIVVHHQFNYENKYYEFLQPAVSERFGAAYTSSVNDKVRYNRMYNLVGAAYANETIGTVEFYIEDFNYNYFYRSIILGNDNQIVTPNSINDRIDTYGARYTYQKGKWNGTALISNSITDQSLTNIDVKARYTFDERNSVSARYQKMNKLPDHNYVLYQSDYRAYNWYNPGTNNEKINSFEFAAKTKWLDASLQYTILNDHLYFSNDYVRPDDAPATALNQLITTPKQYGNTINYLSVKVAKEFKWWKLGLDNTVLYQNVQQPDNVLNVPQLVTRNSLYFTDRWFKKALFIQTGFTFQYFTKYYMNDYNPLINEFFVQDQKEYGGFPLIDFFINMKIQEFQLFLKAEHFNSSFTGYDFYSAPNYPYRDFMVRFGITWNFFS